MVDGGYKNVTHIEGGLSSYRARGLPLEASD